MRWVRNNSLSLFFLSIFAVTLVAQSIAGHRDYNEEQLAHDSQTLSYGRYLASSSFGRAMLENWQSEWLQFILFTLATVWLVQHGSPESKKPGDEGLESDEQQLIGPHAKQRSPAWAKTGGWRTRVYSNSFLLVMLAIFLGSWLAQSLTGSTEFNDDQREHDQPTVSWSGYLAKPRFWEETFQNWQSEFLAVGTMVVFTIYLRQRGSPESKPVGSPHDETHASG